MWETSCKCFLATTSGQGSKLTTSLAGFLPSDTAEHFVNSSSTTNSTLQEVAANATSAILPNRTQSEMLEVVLISQLGPGVRLVKLAWQAYRQWLTTPRNATATPTPQIRSFIFASTFNVPSPYHIFQGQILSVALAALIISLVFLREWFSSYDWSQHDPAPPVEEEEINPDEWRIRDGQATRIFATKRERKRRSVGGATVGEGKQEVASIEEAMALLIRLQADIVKSPLPSGAPVLARLEADAGGAREVERLQGSVEVSGPEYDVLGQTLDASVGMSRYPSAPPEDVSPTPIPPILARSSSSPSVSRPSTLSSTSLGHTSGLQLRPPPLDRKKSSLQVIVSPFEPLSPASSGSPPPLSSSYSTDAEAEAGPGPSTLAARSASPTTSPALPALPVLDLMAGQQARDFLREAEAMRQARSRLAEGRTESSTWKAPELLVNKGKGRAVDPQVSTDKEEMFEPTRNPASPSTSKRTSPMNSRHPSVALWSESVSPQRSGVAQQADEVPSSPEREALIDGGEQPARNGLSFGEQLEDVEPPKQSRNVEPRPPDAEVEDRDFLSLKQGDDPDAEAGTVQSLARPPDPTEILIQQVAPSDYTGVTTRGLLDVDEMEALQIASIDEIQPGEDAPEATLTTALDNEATLPLEAVLAEEANEERDAIGEDQDEAEDNEDEDDDDDEAGNDVVFEDDEGDDVVWGAEDWDQVLEGELTTSA